MRQIGQNLANHPDRLRVAVRSVLHALDANVETEDAAGTKDAI
jgi:hypothetical protein